MANLRDIRCPTCCQVSWPVDCIDRQGGDTYGKGQFLGLCGGLAEPRADWDPVQPQAYGAYKGNHPALFVPEADPSFWVDELVARFLHSVADRSRKGEIVNILLVGAAGTGKSSLPKEFAATWGRPLFTMHCQLVTEPADWWGSKEMSTEKGTYFQRAALVDAVETPGAVILLDEANRTHPENLNVLFGLLDHRRRVWVPALCREVVVAPGVMFMVTLNEGMEFVGTSPIDRALRDRISNTVRLGFLPGSVEASILVERTRIDEGAARRLVEFASTVRRNPKLGIGVSTRQLLECAALMKEGLPPNEAVLFAIVNAAEDELTRQALLQALQLTGEVREAYAERQRFQDD